MTNDSRGQSDIELLSNYISFRRSLFYHDPRREACYTVDTSRDAQRCSLQQIKGGRRSPEAAARRSQWQYCCLLRWPGEVLK